MATLNDQFVLSSNGLFLQRVRQSIITQALAVSSDGLSTGVNIKRHVQVRDIMMNPETWKNLFAAAIVTQAAVIDAATTGGTVVLTPMVTAADGSTTGNADAKQALVSDTIINNTVSAVFNAFFGGQ